MLWDPTLDNSITETTSNKRQRVIDSTAMMTYIELYNRNSTDGSLVYEVYITIDDKETPG